jgi:hypothetical protein
MVLLLHCLPDKCCDIVNDNILKRNEKMTRRWAKATYEQVVIETVNKTGMNSINLNKGRN